MKYEEKFKNELGNDIFISVEEKDIAGVPGIFISMEGPDSKTENHITRAEAKVLLQKLGEILK